MTRAARSARIYLLAAHEIFAILTSYESFTLSFVVADGGESNTVTCEEYKIRRVFHFSQLEVEGNETKKASRRKAPKKEGAKCEEAKEKNNDENYKMRLLHRRGARSS